jgi:lysophospholipase L1-like esterase
MKKISLVLALIFSVLITTAQSINRVKGIWYYQVLGADSALKCPLDTLASAPVGSIAVKNDVPYFKHSTGAWLSLAGAVANLATTNLTATGDYSHNWNNKQLVIDSVRNYTLFARAKQFGIWHRTNITMNPGSDQLIIQNVTRKSDNSADSVTAVFQMTTSGTIHMQAGDISGSAASIDINGAPGGGKSRVTILGDTVAIQAIPRATADSGLAIGPYNPATKSNPVYKVKFPTPSTISLGNIGFGYRWLYDPSGLFKTAVGRTGVTIDSASDANALTFRADTNFVATKTFAQARQITDSSFVSGTDTIRIRRLGYARNTYAKAAVGISASASVANYPATKVDSIFYKFSTSPYGSGSAQDYGGWLTNNLTGDSIKISAPFWVCIGNSITEGHPSTHGRLHPSIDLTKDDVPGQITYYLRQLANMRFFNQGIGGQTSSQIWARWDRDVLAKTVSGITTLTEKPQGVIIECGINDFYGGISVATLKQNLIKMAASCAREGIYCVILTVPGDEVNNYTQNKQVDEINYWLRTGALNRYHVAIVDFNKWWKDAAYNDNMHGNSLLIDDIHPTPAGYDSLAHFIYREAKLPRLESMIVHTELSPDGFTGYSRPASVSFNNTAYTIDAAIDTLPIVFPVGIDTAWLKINTSTSVTGTTYTGISHVEYLMSYPVDNNLFTNGKESGKQTLYPYVTLKDGKIGIQTENPSTPFETAVGISRTDAVPIGPELRTYHNLAGAQSNNGHTVKGAFYITLPDGVDQTFLSMELDIADGSNGTSKIIIGWGNHVGSVHFDGFMNYYPTTVRIFGKGGFSDPGYIMIGDSLTNWDYAVMKISRVSLWAGFFLDKYASYDTIKPRFTTQPLNFYNSVAPTVNFTINSLNTYAIGTAGAGTITGMPRVGGLSSEKVVVMDTITRQWKTTSGLSFNGNTLIGTTTDDGVSKLQVNGNIYSAGAWTFGANKFMTLGEYTSNFLNLTINGDAATVLGVNLAFKDAANKNTLVTPKTSAIGGAAVVIGGNSSNINSVGPAEIGIFTSNSGSETAGATYSDDPAVLVKGNKRVLIGGTTDNTIGKLQVSGKATITTMDSTATPNNLVYQEPGTGELKKTAFPILKGSTTWTPGIVAAGSSVTTTLTITGAALGDPVTVSKASGAYSNGEVYDAFVSSANTVTIRVHNVSTGSANYNTSETYKCVLLKY